MAITSAIVLYAVFWFLTLFCILPLRMISQGDTGDIARGTHASAPANPQMKRKFRLTTLISFAIWVPVCLAIIYDVITMDMLTSLTG